MNDQLMLDVARYIEKHCEGSLPLKTIAKEFLLSESHLQKRFKSALGVSPKEYQEACRLKKFRTHLRGNKTVTHALYESGHQSSSRVYEKLDEKVGMTPRQYQKNGEGQRISWAMGKTSLGKILIAATDRGICFLQFGKSKGELLKQLQLEFPKANILSAPKSSSSEFAKWMMALNDYLQGDLKKLDLPIDMKGTIFQMRVWKFLLKIPRGETISYSELAQKTGNPRAVRAVASACARNRIGIIIPCHRVLRGSGDLAGYRWGLSRKKYLLKIESAIIEA